MRSRRHWIERAEERHRQHASATYQAFIDDLVRIHPMSRELAERAAVSVLWRLERRFKEEEGRHLEAQLPLRLRELLAELPRLRPVRFGHLDLIEWVADDLGCPVAEADRIARAVLQAVRKKISEGEADHIAAALPVDLALLWRHPG
jgi:uncharacterized protein (DUF2267 family)